MQACGILIDVLLFGMTDMLLNAKLVIDLFSLSPFDNVIISSLDSLTAVMDNVVRSLLLAKLTQTPLNKWRTEQCLLHILVCLNFLLAPFSHQEMAHGIPLTVMK